MRDIYKKSLTNNWDNINISETSTRTTQIVLLKGWCVTILKDNRGWYKTSTSSAWLLLSTFTVSSMFCRFPCRRRNFPSARETPLPSLLLLLLISFLFDLIWLIRYFFRVFLSIYSLVSMNSIIPRYFFFLNR